MGNAMSAQSKDKKWFAPGSVSEPTYCEFPREEFERRYDRLRVEMYRYGIDALIATNEPNNRYLTGARNQRWPNVLRPQAVILPLTGDPIMISPSSDLFGLHTVTWIKDLRGFGGRRIKDGYASHLINMIVDVLHEQGISRGRVGIERDWQMRAGLAIDEFLDLEKRLAPIELVDSSPIWWDVRMFKSDLEIDCMRRAAQITSAAFADLEQELRIGMTEKEIEQRMCALLMQHGAERPTYIPVNVHAERWPMHEHLVFGTSTDRVLEPDNLVDMDAGCTYNGYWSDFNRTFGFGRVPEKARVAYQVGQEVINAAIDAVRPGDPVSAVYRAMSDTFTKANKSAGISETGMSESGINGHGLGLCSTERPYVNLEETAIMTPGLFFTLEPIFAVEGFGMALAEEMIVVTEIGCEVLSTRAAPDLPMLG